MISACILSAAWRRFDVTRLVLQQRQALCAELAARGVQATSLIVADDENIDIAREYGALTLEHPNDPLGAKANAGLQHAASLADWVVWIGSDDWIHPDAFDPLLAEAPDGPGRIIAGQRLSMVDTTTGEIQRIRTPSQYGAIPWFLESRLLQARQAVRRGPIRPEIPRGLDGSLVQGLRRSLTPFRHETHDMHEFRCVDFKTPENLSAYEGVKNVLADGAPEPAAPVLRQWFPPDLVDQAELLFARNHPSEGPE